MFGRVTRLVPFLNVIERVSVADRPAPRVLRLFAQDLIVPITRCRSQGARRRAQRRYGSPISSRKNVSCGSSAMPTVRRSARRYFKQWLLTSECNAPVSELCAESHVTETLALRDGYGLAARAASFSERAGTRSNYDVSMFAGCQRPYQRPRPYKPPPPSSRTRTTMTRIVVISMCSSYRGAISAHRIITSTTWNAFDRFLFLPTYSIS
jgi:hypothetical protein